MNKKVIIIILSVMILGLSIGYAALSSSLNITGSARLGATADSWNINFKNARCTGYNYAEAGDIEIKNKTTIELSNSKLKAPKDYIICNFDIVNDGTIDAKVTSVTYPDKNKFTYTGIGDVEHKSSDNNDVKATQMSISSSKEEDEKLVKSNLIVEMKYQDNTEIKLGDELKAKETKKAYIKISLSDNMSKLPTNDVSISDIFGQIIYGQYKVGDTDITEDILSNTGNVVYYNPETGEKNCSDYTSSNSVSENKTGCMKWYVISSSGSNVNLILDHNTTNKVAWNTSGNKADGPATANAQLASDVSNWTSQAKSTARMITFEEVKAMLPSYSSLSEEEFINNYFDDLQTAAQQAQANINQSDYSTGKAYYLALINYLKNNSSVLLPSYMFEDILPMCSDDMNCPTHGYWTSSLHYGKISRAWGVYAGGYLDRSSVDNADSFGLRPVITISKS